MPAATASASPAPRRSASEPRPSTSSNASASTSSGTTASRVGSRWLMKRPVSPLTAVTAVSFSLVPMPSRAIQFA